MNNETAQAYMEAITRYFTTKLGYTPEFTLNDHNHEELEVGQWSITGEVRYDLNGRNWLSILPTNDKAPKYLSKFGVTAFSVGIPSTFGIGA